MGDARSRPPRYLNKKTPVTGTPPQRTAQSRVPATPEPRGEHEELADEILRRLEERGLPQGAWLADIARVRRALQDADALLRRFQEAIIAGSSPRPES